MSPLSMGSPLRWWGDAREMPIRDDRGSIKGMTGKIGDIPDVDGLASEAMGEGFGEDAGSR